jgi:hypothetical protein
MALPCPAPQPSRSALVPIAAARIQTTKIRVFSIGGKRHHRAAIGCFFCQDTFRMEGRIRF